MIKLNLYKRDMPNEDVIINEIKDGDIAMIMLRVTTKELESVFSNTGYETLMIYRFGSDIDGSLFKNMVWT